MNWFAQCIAMSKLPIGERLKSRIEELQLWNSYSEIADHLNLEGFMTRQTDQGV